MRHSPGFSPGSSGFIVKHCHNSIVPLLGLVVVFALANHANICYNKTIMERSQEAFPGLTPEQIAMYAAATKSLRNQAARHANLGRFKLIERPDDYYQDFREVYYPPVNEPSLEIIASTCRRILGEDGLGYSNFDTLVDVFYSNAKAIQQAKDIMESGGRIMLITSHRELVDVAMVMAAAQYAIGSTDIVKRTRLFVGPITKELEIVGRSAIEALQNSGGVIVSLPDTDSTEEQIASGEIDRSIKEVTNTAVKDIFEDQIINDEISLVATAPSGSTDQETNNIITMRPVSRGTDVLARRYFDALWPAAVVMSDKQLVFEVGDILILSKGETLHDVMENKLAPMYQRISGKNVVYQRPKK